MLHWVRNARGKLEEHKKNRKSNSTYSRLLSESVDIRILERTSYTMIAGLNFVAKSFSFLYC